jgi:hypothetical protein
MMKTRITIAATALAMLTAACGTATSTDTQAVDTTAVDAVATTSGSVGAASEITISDETAGLTYAVVDTGQSTCYNDTSATTCPESGSAFFGQDANYQANEATYLDNGDGTVSDLVTGLMWQQDPGAKMTFSEAAAGADSFGLAGYDDWRLPTIKELYSLIDFSGTDPSGCQTSECGATPFIDTDYFAFEYGDTDAGERMIDSQWATSTVYEGLTMGGNETMFGVNFADGRIKGYPMSDPQGEKGFFVIYVRGNTSYGENAFVDNGDGSVTDLATGLTWQQGDSVTGMDWSEALDYCEALDVAGSTDWTLPDAKQLQSIVDYTRSPSATGTAAIDPVFDTTEITDESGGSDWGSYWSSTTHASLNSVSNAAYVSFGEALGWMQDPRTGEYELQDVHGAGAQRSDPKTGDAADYPYGHGPQGDVIRIDNLVRCVSSSDAQVVTGGEAPAAAPAESSSEQPATGGQPAGGGPLADAAQQLGVTEDALVAALGSPDSGPPDFDAAAAVLGVTVEDLMAAVGAPQQP